MSDAAPNLGTSQPRDARAVAIIPARLASTRFPRKVLADATGMPLIWHVYERARLAPSVARVVVATDAEEVANVVRARGGEVVLTSVDHPNGTSRLAEAAAMLGLAADQIVVNVQGDEPELDPEAIEGAVAALIRTGAPVATVATPIRMQADFANPAIVKVVLRRDGTALYFSRATIPFHRDRAGVMDGGGGGGSANGAGPLRHLGLYVYRAGFLARYVQMQPTPLEQTEMLEQLRILEHGEAIAVAEVASRGEGIDTPEQYAQFVERWRASRA